MGQRAAVAGDPTNRGCRRHAIGIAVVLLNRNDTVRIVKGRIDQVIPGGFVICEPIAIVILAFTFTFTFAFFLTLAIFQTGAGLVGAEADRGRRLIDVEHAAAHAVERGRRVDRVVVAIILLEGCGARKFDHGVENLVAPIHFMVAYVTCTVFLRGRTGSRAGIYGRSAGYVRVYRSRCIDRIVVAIVLLAVNKPGGAVVVTVVDQIFAQGTVIYGGVFMDTCDRTGVGAVRKSGRPSAKNHCGGRYPSQ